MLASTPGALKVGSPLYSLGVSRCLLCFESPGGAKSRGERDGWPDAQGSTAGVERREYEPASDETGRVRPEERGEGAREKGNLGETSNGERLRLRRCVSLRERDGAG